jgi:ribokinase
MTEFDAVGFGALNVDRLFKVDRIAAVEEESSVIDYSEACGGSAANTIVGLARLGRKVGFLGKVASDSDGKMLRQNFKNERVDTKGITIAKEGRSGKVMGFVDRDGQRALYVDPGVNDNVEPKNVSLAYAANTKLLHVSSFVGEESFQTQKWLVERIGDMVKLSFDPGAIYARRGMKGLRSIIRRTTIMLPNAGELALITGKNDYGEGARLLVNEGVKIVAIKLGSKGCYVTDGKESHLVEPFKVKAIDTTGAGDAFDAGFLYGLLKEMAIDDAARIGNYVASKCITAMGARTGLPTLEELKADIKM